MRLEAITAELHVFDGVINWRQPLKLGLSIRERKLLRLGSRGGDTLTLDHEPLMEMDMEEFGQVVVRDITDRLGASLRDSETGEARLIRLARGEPIGLALPRPDGSAFCIWVNDDEFYWGDEVALGSEDFAACDPPAIGGELDWSAVPESGAAHPAPVDSRR
jgi:hypothetical protein